MQHLPDGVYEVQVLDAEDRPDGSIDVEVTITSGPRAGETTSVHVAALDLSSFEALGLSGVLRVAGGVPTLEL